MATTSPATPSYLAADSVAERPSDLTIVRRLGGYLARQRGLVAACVGLVLLSSAAVTAGPWLLGRAVDQGVVAGDPHLLLVLALVMLAVQGVGTATTAGEGFLFAVLGQGVLHDLRQDLFARVQSLPTPFFDRNPVGRLVTRLTNDIAALGELFAPSVVGVAVDVVVIVAVSAALFLLDPLLAATAFLLFPVLVAVTFVFGRRIRGVFRDVKGRLARINAGLGELIPGMRVVQLFGREEDERDRFTQLNGAYRDAQLKGVRYNALLHPLVQVCAGGTVAALLLLGGWRVHAGVITVGTLVAFLTYAQHLFQPVRGLIEKYNLFQTAMASAERIFLLLDEQPEVGWGGELTQGEAPAGRLEEGSAPPPGERATPRTGGGRGGGALSPARSPAAGDRGNGVAASLPARLRGEIRFRDVHLTYDGGVTALSGLDFAVAPGEVVALVGPTGAGKSTVASLLLRLFEPSRGTIELDGQPLGAYPKGFLRRRVGLIGQEVFLFDATLRENLCLFRAVDEARLMAAIRQVGLEAVVARLPEGLEARVGERGGRLSLGERQLIAFARFLLYDPDILVLDEATASIDRTTERTLQHALQVVTQGRTTLIIAHRLETVRHADRVVVLEGGKKIEEGEPERLLGRLEAERLGVPQSPDAG